MRKLAVLILACTACQEPPKTAPMDSIVRSLSDLHAWDPSTEAQGQWGYDMVMARGTDPQMLHMLASYVADETPTQIYDRVFDLRVSRGDVCFYLLLKLTPLDKKEFFEDGAYMTSLLPNPIFCIRWKDGLASRRKVQVRLAKLLPPLDP